MKLSAYECNAKQVRNTVLEVASKNEKALMSLLFALQGRKKNTSNPCGVQSAFFARFASYHFTPLRSAAK